MHMHPSLWHPNGPNSNFHYFVHNDYCMLISRSQSATEQLSVHSITHGLALWAMFQMFCIGPMLNSPSDNEISFSGFFILRWTSFMLPSTTSWGQYNNLPIRSNMEDNYVIPVLHFPFQFRQNVNIKLGTGWAEQCQPSINQKIGPVVDNSSPHVIV